MNDSLIPLLILTCSFCRVSAQHYHVVDTMQRECFDTLKPIPSPRSGSDFYGQDAQYQGLQAQYVDHGDGTVSDLVTGLMWTKEVDLNKMTLPEARAFAGELRAGGFNDWRVPSIKELYSLIDFRGATGLWRPGSSVPPDAVPFINTDFFDFAYGQTEQGERYIDAQWLSDTEYVSTTMFGNKTLFGVNFADGRIKGYGMTRPHGRGEKTFYVRFVRGNPAYGHNDFVDNGDGTLTDRGTGLTWMQMDSGKGMTWKEALAYAASLELGGHRDWRLPDAKELQSIVDYSRSPATTGTAALDPLFSSTPILNEAGGKDWAYYWTSTTHVDGPNARQAVVLCFGRAIGLMYRQVLDVHGAGAQRSDPKEGRAQLGHGPQGDARRVYNFVRCVRGGEVQKGEARPENPKAYPHTVEVRGKRYQPQEMQYHSIPPHRH